MLMKLSFRNVKRQFDEYTLFFVTLTSTVASMYAFNALIFSDTVKALPEMELLPYLIIAASLLIILIMGWMISYMVNYILKRRSREFSVYMVSGIQNRKISTLFFYENSLIGLLAFFPGILLGMLISQILEAVLLNMFGLPYMLHLGFSLPALGLTFLYFSAMLLFSIRKNGKWICRVQLRDLLYYDRKTENSSVSGNISAVSIFLLSVFCCVAGFLLICIQPLGKGYDILVGIVFLLLFLFGFFISTSAFLVTYFGNRSDWKYRKQRLITFRDFTGKIHSTSTVMGILSILFMLAITFGGIGTTVGLMAARNVEASAFDVLILHPGEQYDFSRYETIIQKSFPLQSHTYEIYTGGKTDFLSGKWADKAEFSYLYAMVICLFYLAFILEISAAAILATQVLSDWQEKQRQDRILRQLGMNEQLVYKLNNRQLLLLFLFPIFPSLLLSGCFISICAKKILVLFFELPPTPDFLLIGQSLGISLVLFALIYGVYFVAAQICYEHRRK